MIERDQPTVERPMIWLRDGRGIKGYATHVPVIVKRLTPWRVMVVLEKEKDFPISMQHRIAVRAENLWTREDLAKRDAEERSK
jgi:hypothetical protein